MNSYLQTDFSKKMDIFKQTGIIDANGFKGCNTLTHINIPSEIKEFGQYAFYGCYRLRKIEIPQTVKVICEGAFTDCKLLESAIFEDNDIVVGPAIFKNCKNLKEVNLPFGLTEITEDMFNNCVNLEEIEIPETVEVINWQGFAKCDSLKKVVLPSKGIKLGTRSFYCCKNLETIENLTNITEVDTASFTDCQSLKELSFPNVVVVGSGAFENCTSLEKISFGSNKIFSAGQNIFAGCNFKYFYKNKNSGELVFANELPDEEVESVIEIEKISNYISEFDIGVLLSPKLRKQVVRLANNLQEANLKIPYSFIQSFIFDRQTKELDSLDFRFLANEILDIKGKFNLKFDAYMINSILKFAKAIGCLSDEKMYDKNGTQTNVLIGQKASTFLGNMLRHYVISYEQYEKMFQDLKLNTKTNQHFLDFISLKEGDSYPNVELLLMLENEKKGTFRKVLENFDEVKAYRKFVDANGKPRTRAWKDAITEYQSFHLYEGITDETKDIAEVFSRMGMGQGIFTEAKKIRIKAIKNGVKSHILGEPLKEKSILEEIEEIQKTTQAKILDSAKLIKEAFKKQFTYEMLDKHDPRNAIIGVYCDCCATITNSYYGNKIARATIQNNDVQNMIIRDVNDQIIAKGTIYVNEKLGYAVINDFEINDKFKKNQSVIAGIYTDDDLSEKENERNLIFSAFMRGIKAFVKKYDELHPNCKIKQVNVGMTYNRLRTQCERFEHTTQGLKVPEEYSFDDAKASQIVLYRADEQNLQAKGDLMNENDFKSN